MSNSRPSTTSSTVSRPEVVEGLEFDKGYMSPYFATDMTKLTAELEDCQIII